MQLDKPDIYMDIVKNGSSSSLASQVSEIEYKINTQFL